MILNFHPCAAPRTVIYILCLQPLCWSYGMATSVVDCMPWDQNPKTSHQEPNIDVHVRASTRLGAPLHCNQELALFGSADPSSTADHVANGSTCGRPDLIMSSKEGCHGYSFVQLYVQMCSKWVWWSKRPTGDKDSRKIITKHRLSREGGGKDSGYITNTFCPYKHASLVFSQAAGWVSSQIRF